MDADDKDRLARLNDMSNEACGFRLRAVRRALGLGQAGLAHAAEIGNKALQNAEAGRNQPNATVMRHLYRQHRIDFNFLLNGSYAQLPGDVQELLFPALEAEENEPGQRQGSGRRRVGRPRKQLPS